VYFNQTTGRDDAAASYLHTRRPYYEHLYCTFLGALFTLHYYHYSKVVRKGSGGEKFHFNLMTYRWQKKLLALLPVMITSEMSSATLEQKSVTQAMCVCDRERIFIASKASSR
jgi:hypothetical protein